MNRAVSAAFVPALAVSLLLASCDRGDRRGSPTQQARAEAACRAALRNGSLVSALPATVGQVRRTTLGTTPPSGGQLAHEFEPAAAASFAAWCWRRVGDEYESYVVGPTGQSDTVLSGQTDKPLPGPPTPP